MYLLGYDIGSSSIKTALVDARSNKTVAVVQYPESSMDIIARQSGWAEQQPELWWQNVCMATQKLLAKCSVDPREIKGIGISYQMHGLVLIDKNKQVLRPSIIWCDSRAVPIGQQAFKALGEQHCLENYLNSPGNFTASKLKWIKDNEPEVYDKIYKMMLPGDYIAMRLTGEINTTIGGLSEAILWNYKKKKVAIEVLNYYGLSEELLPEIVGNFDIQGEVQESAASQAGLVAGIPVAYRAGDQPNNALSLNVLNPGEIAATSGTSGVVYGIVDRPLYDTKSRVNSFTHVNYENNYDRIGVLLCLNGAGIQYGWMKNQIALGGRQYEDMERMAGTVPVGSDGLCILPFGNGAERVLMDKNVNAHILNLEFNRHTRAHLYRSALEGVAFSFVHGVNLLKEMGLAVDIMRVSNDNMFQSEVFAMTMATLLDCHIEVVDTTGAVGAAQASGVGVGIYANIEEALYNIETRMIHEPRLNQAMCHQAYHYWASCLDKTLYEMPSKSNRPEELRAKNDELKKHLEDKNKELASVAMQMHNKDEFLKEIQQTLADALGDLNSAQSKITMQKLVDKIAGQSTGNKDWDRFEDQFNLLHSDFFKKLKSDFPNLTVAEAKLCMLLKMKLTTKDIASQLNLSVRGVETRRYRLRKKLSAEKEFDLDKFLDRL
ncbi:FGGY family carbohydrate kinase [Reichenbachiella carrageenanivorans]|uniref:FGGY family carbohydrate kinase n=1 Tax=Reichenbachiella carrageenanivorans TaxID=2979869 RepID=A0ABY6D7L2_9BACT|nr:FGGY family carbohydrate kinase [Reichenbachiella carrageenanivorans]UXX79835.1 FGGY family carbohydrate kinase [Reichenbachiella carrageenanivorans]